MRVVEQRLGVDGVAGLSATTRSAPDGGAPGAALPPRPNAPGPHRSEDTVHMPCWGYPERDGERSAIRRLQSSPDEVLAAGLVPCLPEGGACACGAPYAEPVRSAKGPATVFLFGAPTRRVDVYELRSTCGRDVCTIFCDGYAYGLVRHSSATFVAAEHLYNCAGLLESLGAPTQSYCALAQRQAARLWGAPLRWVCAGAPSARSAGGAAVHVCASVCMCARTHVRACASSSGHIAVACAASDSARLMCCLPQSPLLLHLRVPCRPAAGAQAAQPHLEGMFPGHTVWRALFLRWLEALDVGIHRPCPHPGCGASPQVIVCDGTGIKMQARFYVGQPVTQRCDGDPAPRPHTRAERCALPYTDERHPISELAKGLLAPVQTAPQQQAPAQPAPLPAVSGQQVLPPDASIVIRAVNAVRPWARGVVQLVCGAVGHSAWEGLRPGLRGLAQPRLLDRVGMKADAAARRALGLFMSCLGTESPVCSYLPLRAAEILITAC